MTSELTYKIVSENKYKFIKLNPLTGDIYLQKSIVNSASEIKVTVNRLLWTHNVNLNLEILLPIKKY